MTIGGAMREDEYENPFYRGILREKYSTWEFDLFALKARAAVEEAAAHNPRLQRLKKAVGFYVDDRNGTVQVGFGVHRRKKLRKPIEEADGKWLHETQAHLVWSAPYVGAGVATTLYPAESKDARVTEDRIYIRIGDFSGSNLLDWVKKDIDALTAYAHVTSVDGSPTLKEKFKVWWLRRFHPSSVDSKHTQPAGIQQAQAFIEFSGRTLVVAVLKPIGILLLIILLVVLGLPQLAELISEAAGK